jgi:glutathione peroxidase
MLCSKVLPLSIGLVFCVMAGVTSRGEQGGGKVPAALNFAMAGLDGKTVELSKYQGKVVLIVNVASECGFTPQYKSLQAIYAKHAADGLVIVGVPCNQFGQQEPGTNQDIADFCDKNYGVTFPMLAKVDVNGGNACPLYKYLTGKDTNPKFAGRITWNFEKFLVGRAGDIVARFAPNVDPDGAAFQKALTDELSKKLPAK